MTEAIIAFEHQGTLLSIARDRLLKANKKRKLSNIDTLINLAPEQAEWARKQKESGFSDIHRHSIVSIWGALEVCIEDTIVLILINDPSCYKSLVESGIKMKEGYKSNIKEKQAHLIYKSIERKVRANHGAGKAFVEILRLFEINIFINNQLISILDEINEVRNCILHNSGIINDKATMKVPNLKKYLNREILIDRDKFSEYFESVSNLSLAILESMPRSKYLHLE